MLSDHRLREGWTAAGLLLLMLLCIALSISVADWVEGLAMLAWVVLVGGLLGVVSAKSYLPAGLAHGLSGLSGLSWSAWLTSRVLSSQLHLPATEALLELDWRLQSWVTDVATRGESAISHVMLLVLCLLLWLVAYFSAWAVFRWQRPWWAVIGCSVAMLVNVTAAPSHQTWFLLAYLLLALLLIVRTSLTSYEQEWRRERVNYAPEVVMAFLRAGLTVAVVALALAWIVPQAAAGNRLADTWNKMREPWRKIQERWEDAFQDLSYREAPPAVLVSRSMAFGGPVKLTDRPIMDIKAEAGRYWRSHAYDRYLGWGWLNTDPQTLALGADSEKLMPQPEYRERAVLTQTVTLRQDLGKGQALTASGDPLRVSVSVQAVVGYLTPTVSIATPEVGPRPEPGLSGASLLFLKDGLPAGTVYRAVSSVSVVAAESLRQAGTSYPAWVEGRYLQLPESLPSRVRRLAEELTGGLASPYDKVVAVEAYLRRFHYSQSIEGPEPGQDGVDYFLFEEKSGYCSYYASAMVVLLRASGVPARYAEGYSRSQAASGVYHILEKDGHAWPEVFFPEYGWVEFEPTAAQALTARSPAVSTTAQAVPPGYDRPLPLSDDFEDPYLRERGYGGLPDRASVPFWRKVSAWVWAVLAAALGSAGLGAWLWSRQRRRLLSLSAAERSYYLLVRRSLRLLRIRPLEHQTPLEYAQAVSTAVPSAASASVRIAELYVAERFGRKEDTAGEAETAWRQAGPELWRRWVQLRVEAVRLFLRSAWPLADRAPVPHDTTAAG